jgi:hypothetical protein
MKGQNFVFILLFTGLCLACSQKAKTESGKITVEEVAFTDIVDAVEPPPPNQASSFKSLEEWLSNICENENPEKSIASYSIGLFESSTGSVIFLAGFNKYNINKDSSNTRIEFEPANMYFPLPEKEYASLNRSQLLNKLTGQLKTFAGTEKFKHSFLAKADTILFDSSGEIIWSKNAAAK